MRPPGITDGSKFKPILFHWVKKVTHVYPAEFGRLFGEKMRKWRNNKFTRFKTSRFKKISKK
jgi:hypothetical protein